MMMTVTLKQQQQQQQQQQQKANKGHGNLIEQRRRTIFVIDCGWWANAASKQTAAGLRLWCGHCLDWIRFLGRFCDNLSSMSKHRENSFEVPSEIHSIADALTSLDSVRRKQ